MSLNHVKTFFSLSEGAIIKCWFVSKIYELQSCCEISTFSKAPGIYCRLNRLCHTLSWKCPISVLGTVSPVMRLRYFWRKIAKPFANSGDSDQRGILRIWSGSALFDNYPFRGLQITFGLGVPDKYISYYMNSTKTYVAPCQGASNEYPQHILLWRNKKKFKTFCKKSALSGTVL